MVFCEAGEQTSVAIGAFNRIVALMRKLRRLIGVVAHPATSEWVGRRALIGPAADYDYGAFIAA